MTIKELLNRKPLGYTFLDFMEFLRRNKLQIEGIIEDLDSQIIKLDITGLSDEDKNPITFRLHLSMTDEVTEDEDLYAELIRFAFEHDWGVLNNYTKFFYLIIHTDDGIFMDGRDCKLSLCEQRRIYNRLHLNNGGGSYAVSNKINFWF